MLLTKPMYFICPYFCGGNSWVPSVKWKKCNTHVKGPLNPLWRAHHLHSPKTRYFHAIIVKLTQFYPCKILNARIALLISSYQAAAFSPNIHFSKKIIFCKDAILWHRVFTVGGQREARNIIPPKGKDKGGLKSYLSLISMPKYAHSRSISTDEQLFVWSFYQPSSKALRWLKKLLKVPRGVLLSFVWSFMEIVFRCQHPSELIALLLR